MHFAGKDLLLGEVRSTEAIAILKICVELVCVCKITKERCLFFMLYK